MASTAPNIGKELTFLCSWFCPFAQRTYIALLEKKLKFTYHEVSLRNPQTGLWYPLQEKPKWFTDLNPLGKVPTLAYESECEPEIQTIYESLICNEFLEVFALGYPAFRGAAQLLCHSLDYATSEEHPAMLPPHPAVRARARIIMDHFNTQFVPLFYRILVRQDKQQQQEVGKELVAQCKWLENNIDSNGPYFMGEQFSLVDCAIIPWFVRGYIMEHFRQIQLPPSDCPRLLKWLDVAMKRPSVTGSFRPPEEGASYKDKLLEHYIKYADGTANSTSAAAFK